MVTRVCAYDRAGQGCSDSSPTIRSFCFAAWVAPVVLQLCAGPTAKVWVGVSCCVGELDEECGQGCPLASIQVRGRARQLLVVVVHLPHGGQLDVRRQPDVSSASTSLADTTTATDAA
jgi:hypothetical protein